MVAVEQVFFQVNVRTAMSVGQASGLALCEAAAAGCEVVQYTPNQVKDAVAGYGAAGKQQVQKMVQARLKLTRLPQPADAADAAALALCHLAMAPLGAASGPVAVGGGRPMIGSLRGQVLERDLAGSVLIEVGGVGYVVHVSPRALAELEPSTPAFLYVHHHIREDTQQLYGFLTRDERRHVPDADQPRTASGRRWRWRSSPPIRRRRWSTSWPTATSPRSRSCPASARRPPSAC